MYRIWLVATLLLPFISGIAEAAQNPEQMSKKQSKHARATLVVLGEMGINQPEIVEFVNYVDKNLHHGYLRIAEERAFGGTLSLKYKFTGRDESPVSKRGPVLQYIPDNSHWEYTAGTEGVMVNYRLKF
jgi:hypothetical protein